ncbi:hypothetical protein BDZ89DRAFT_987081 [Hymenopellis radicata]|nr:hypothetical protein BDZ89DRAFT_987080 [Hymenopellis radicata]KAF9027844.1 hypothetical protein BDZ89DRAFT_987081 [Hymenopellis radicata]
MQSIRGISSAGRLCLSSSRCRTNALSRNLPTRQLCRSTQPSHAVRNLLATRPFSTTRPHAFGFNIFSKKTPEPTPETVAPPSEIVAPPPEIATPAEPSTLPSPADEAVAATSSTASPPITEAVSSTPVTEVASSTPVTEVVSVSPSSAVDVVASSLPGVSADAIMAALTPLQYGDLASMGLMGWTPAALFRYVIQFLHISVGMPWFWTILASSVIARLVVVPLSIQALQLSGRMTAIRPQLEVEQAKIKEAGKRHDVLVQSAAARKTQKLLEDSGYSVSKAILSGGVPIIWSFATFYATARVVWNVPQVAQYSGFWLLPDMSATAPGWMCAGMGGMTFVAIRAALGDPGTEGYIKRMDLLSFVLPALIPFSFWAVGGTSGVGIYIMATAGVMQAQSLILRHPAVRARLGLAPRYYVPFLPSLRAVGPNAREAWGDFKAWFFQPTQAVAAATKKPRRR